MKIACSSASFDAALADRTQLEWLDACASEFRVDGVVFDTRHFPRTDEQYLAQLKKTAVDLGLTVAAVAIGTLGEADAATWFPIAHALGAPLVIASAPSASENADAWSALCADVKAATSIAKRVNVPLALRNRPGTLCAEGTDLQRLAKDVDSSWLRYALDLGSGYSDDLQALIAETIVLMYPIDGSATTMLDATARAILEAAWQFRGFFVLEDRRQKLLRPDTIAAVSALRTSIAAHA